MSKLYLWKDGLGGNPQQWSELVAGSGISLTRVGKRSILSSSGTGSVGPGTINRLALFNSSTSISDSSLIENASGVFNLNKVFYSPISGVASSTGVTLNLKLANEFKITLEDDIVLTLSNPQGGAKYVLICKQTLGGNDITWPANFLWAAASSETLSAASGARDIVSFIYDGEDNVFLGSMTQDFS